MTAAAYADVSLQYRRIQHRVWELQHQLMRLAGLISPEVECPPFDPADLGQYTPVAYLELKRKLRQIETRENAMTQKLILLIDVADPLTEADVPVSTVLSKKKAPALAIPSTAQSTTLSTSMATPEKKAKKDPSIESSPVKTNYANFLGNRKFLFQPQYLRSGSVGCSNLTTLAQLEAFIQSVSLLHHRCVGQGQRSAGSRSTLDYDRIVYL